MPEKITLNDGRTGHFVYLGENEEERIQSAQESTVLIEIMGRLANMGALTPVAEQVLRGCLDDRREFIEDPKPATPAGEAIVSGARGRRRGGASEGPGTA